MSDYKIPSDGGTDMNEGQSDIGLRRYGTEAGNGSWKHGADAQTRLTLPLQLLLVAVLVAADQVTKYLAVVNLKGQNPVILIKGVLELYYLENQGAAFSMLQNQQIFFYVLTLLFLLAAGWVLRRIPASKKYNPLRISLLVLCAGAVGNLIDRIIHKYVVDFIYFVIIDFPIFNVADIYVTLGVIVLICLVLFYYRDSDLKVITDGKHGKNSEDD